MTIEQLNSLAPELKPVKGLSSEYDCPRVRFEHALEMEDRRHRKAIERLRKAIHKVRHQCGHATTVFHAMQYDSWTECQICGADV